MSEGQTPGVSHAVSEDRVREELSRVLASHEFRSSKRSQEFLRYVIENTLHGRAEQLKERTIGIEVFGRSTDYDPSDDATVRVKAGEVRKRLGLYYSGEGAQDTVRIELPTGTYIPEFRVIEGVHPPLPVPVPPVERPKLLTARRGALAAAVMVALAALLWLGMRPKTTALDEFWAPVLGGSSPVFVCAAFVPVWGLDTSAPKPFRTGDFVALSDQFVGGGDLMATSRLAAMLTRLHRPYRVKVGNDVSFADMRTGPAILVGYSYTRWKEISAQLRFGIKDVPGYVGITDNANNTEWNLPNLPRDRHTDEDYAIVTRVFHPDTHAMLVELAGITQYGTDAASDLVTNPDLMAEALHDSPQDWRAKNLQLVLKVKVIAGVPTSPKVVKSYFW